MVEGFPLKRSGRGLGEVHRRVHWARSQRLSPGPRDPICRRPRRASGRDLSTGKMLPAPLPAGGEERGIQVRPECVHRLARGGAGGLIERNVYVNR